MSQRNGIYVYTVIKESTYLRLESRESIFLSIYDYHDYVRLKQQANIP